MARILVIDDEVQIRALLRRALEKCGYEVEEATNGAEGVRAFRRRRVDLVVTDIIMPEAEGLGCIRELRGIDPALRIIGISGGGHMDMDVLDVARRFGANRTFRKPFDIADVVAAVGDELDARRAA